MRLLLSTFPANTYPTSSLQWKRHALKRQGKGGRMRGWWESWILNHKCLTRRWMWFHHVFSCLWIGYMREKSNKAFPLLAPQLSRPPTHLPVLQAGGISDGGMKDACLIFLSSGTNTKVVLNKKNLKKEATEKHCDGRRSYAFGRLTILTLLFKGSTCWTH